MKAKDTSTAENKGGRGVYPILREEVLRLLDGLDLEIALLWERREQICQINKLAPQRSFVRLLLFLGSLFPTGLSGGSVTLFIITLFLVVRGVLRRVSIGESIVQLWQGVQRDTDITELLHDPPSPEMCQWNFEPLVSLVELSLTRKTGVCEDPGSGPPFGTYLGLEFL